MLKEGIAIANAAVTTKGLMKLVQYDQRRPRASIGKNAIGGGSYDS